MKTFKLTNKICGECKKFLYAFDKYEGFYCANCNCFWRKKNDDVMSSTNKKSPEQEAFDNWLRNFANTPPLKLKDLKARLKKEREEKRKRTK